ncbi:type II toxin-antitoxin system YafQ family toxin [Helicobacter pylori]|uniref:type II toxin-antitoxin system YafQ family toxin n=1 Tax=Helicobacter pylori TaxID=210 RepID=UPI000AFAF04F|nr:type II toxin-antitoxin system YafQ family toxin [Helicobacter pylori]
MLEVKQTTIFKKELDKHLKNGLSSNILKEVISVLQKQEPLDQKYRDHALKG